MEAWDLFFINFPPLCVFMEASACRKRFKHPFKFKHTKKSIFLFCSSFSIDSYLHTHDQKISLESNGESCENNYTYFRRNDFQPQKIVGQARGEQFRGIEHEREREILQARFYDSRPFVASYFHNNIFLRFCMLSHKEANLRLKFFTNFNSSLELYLPQIDLTR